MRQVVLDTETTGLDPAEGHRIIEIGCVEVVNRRLTGNTYHQYLNPQREIDAAAIEVHGITNEFLADKPRFGDVARDFLEFVKDAEVIIHNAPFDVGFINHELMRLIEGGEIAAVGGIGAAADFRKSFRIEEHATITDSLALARSLHPGQKNDLDSLCKRYGVDNSQRTFHGALLDAEILADVYLAMTGGQTGLFDDSRGPVAAVVAAVVEAEMRRITASHPLRVINASADELAAHHAWLEDIEKKSDGKCVWKRINAAD
jgi:DNA polymerase III subunit epsilon